MRVRICLVIILNLIFLKHLCFCHQFLTYNDSENLETSCKEYAWQKSAFLDEVTWSSLSPYLLPSNHPIKAKLDEIFFKMRATATPLTMKAAGFQTLDSWKWDKAYVARHSQIKGYLIKAFLDNHLFMDDKKSLVNRIIGAEHIRQAIEVYGLQSFFKVPRKWLYQLPDYPDTLPGLYKKNFILIVEDMNIVSDEKNAEMFEQWTEDKQLLFLFYLINTLGLSDSVYISNIPFSKDGKIAFVDTERYHLWPVNFKKLSQKLNREMKNYLEMLLNP